MNPLRTILLLGVLSTLLVAAGACLGPVASWTLAALAATASLLAWFRSDRLLLRLHGARELPEAESPRLHALVAGLARDAGLPKPRLYLVDDPHANAFATGRDPTHAALAVTRGILEVLDERELRAVLAHELAHVASRDTLVASVAAGLAAAVSGLALPDVPGAADGQEGTSRAAGPLLLLTAPLAAALVQLGLSRSREYRADEAGARISGEPLALASALAKLQRSAEQLPSVEPRPATAGLFVVNPFGPTAGGLIRLFSTQPPAEERVRRLRALAFAARPRAPERDARHRVLVAGAGCAAPVNR